MTPVVVLPVSLLKGPFFKGPNEVPVAARAVALLLAAPPSASSSGSLVDKPSICGRWVVSRAGLQTNWCVRIEVAGDALYCCWDATLLLLHRRRSRPPHTLLLIHPRLLLGHYPVIRRWHLRRHLIHRSLTVGVGLRAISRWVPDVASAWCIRIVVGINGT